MATEPDSLLLIYMRRFDERQERMSEDIKDIKVRLTAVEQGLATVHNRIDRVEMRLDRIEKRLDLVDANL